jgi:hypothetical protein
LAGTNQHDWEHLLQQVKDALERGCKPTWAALSKAIGVPRTTLSDGMEREFDIISDKLPFLLENDPEIETIENEFGTYSVRGDDINRTVEVKFDEAKLADIRTLEEMLTVCKVDLSVWEVEKYLINKWPGYRKNKQVSLRWESGRIEDGYVEDEGKLTTKALFQVKIWLKRKIPLKPEIVIQPIEVTYKTEPKKRKEIKKDIFTAMILPDIQFGFRRDFETLEMVTFHDRDALDVAVQLAEYINPDYVIYLGDILDLAEWSDNYFRTPEMYFTTQSSIIEGSWWLNQFKIAAPSAEHELLLGNHGMRIEKAIVNHLKSAYYLRPADELNLPPSMSIQRLLALDKIGIKFIPEYPQGEVWLSDVICCIHGDIARKPPGSTTTELIKHSDVTKIQGHIHRIELTSKNTHNKHTSNTIYGFSPGCLCKVDGSVPGSSNTNQWQQGIGVVYFDNEGNITPIPVPIKDGVALFGGKYFMAEDRLDEIKEDTGWDNL